MSYKSWCKEFYPVPADSKEAKARPLEHSLRKWLGLRPASLRRHGGRAEDASLVFAPGVESLSVDMGTCALCQVHLVGEGSCKGCPLNKVRGAACDSSLSPEEFSPYKAFTCYVDPKPMLALIRKALRLYGEKPKRKAGPKAKPAAKKPKLKKTTRKA